MMTQRVSAVHLLLSGLLIAALACSLSPTETNGVPGPASATPARAQGLPTGPQRDSYEALVTASLVPPQLEFQNGFPRRVQALVPLTGGTPAEQALDFLATYRGLYLQDSPDLGLIVQRVFEGPAAVVTLAQTYKGLPVYGGQLTVTLLPDGSIQSVGNLLPREARLETTPALTVQDAADVARRALGQADAPLLGPGQLLVYDPGLLNAVPSLPRLAWTLTLYGADPSAFLIDAREGTLLDSRSLALDESAAHFNGWDLDLEDANGNNGLDTGCYTQTNDDDAAGDLAGLYEDYAGNNIYETLREYAINSYYFFHDGWGRHAFDGNSGEVEVYGEAGLAGDKIASNYAIAGCDAIDYDTGDYALSDGVLTHEFTHGVIAYTSHLTAAGHAAALNESFADIMGILDTHDWTFDGLVNLPNLLKTYSDYVINGGSHANGHIFTSAFYYQVNGYDIFGHTFGGFGWDARLKNVYYYTMISLGAASSFMDARDQLLFLAPSSGFSPAEVCHLRNGFAKVLIGDPDFDCDGVADTVTDPDNDLLDSAIDNCPLNNNPGQKDLDQDGLGDDCDPDLDGDGHNNNFDNCPKVANPGQENPDLDAFGAACDDFEDPDVDGDGILNEIDNCREDPNPGQQDIDQDGEGDACDPDADRDGISNNNDNCPFTANTDQANADGDGAGDACDPCDQVNDVNAWTSGNADLGIDPKPVVADGDGDGLPDACDRSATVDGRPWPQGLGGITPGRKRAVAEGEPGDLISLPLPACPPESDGSYNPALLQTITLGGMADSIRAWIIDLSGRAAAGSPKPADQRLLSFAPRGGETYRLALQFATGYPGGADEFTLDLTCGIAAEETETPLPAGLTPSPTPRITQAPAITSTPVPSRPASATVYQRPTFTPTPPRVHPPTSTPAPTRGRPPAPTPTRGLLPPPSR